MKTRKMLLTLLLAGLATSLAAQTGPAQGNYRQPPGNNQNAQGMPPGGPGGDGGQHRGPPPEAIAACKGKVSGAACNFVGRQGETLSGTCFTPPSDAWQQGMNNAPAQGNRPAACRPDRGAPGGNRNPDGPRQFPQR